MPPTKKPAITQARMAIDAAAAMPAPWSASAISATTASEDLIRDATPIAPSTIPSIQPANTSE